MFNNNARFNAVVVFYELVSCALMVYFCGSSDTTATVKTEICYRLRRLFAAKQIIYVCLAN